VDVQVSIMMACLIMTDYLRKIIVQGRSSKTTKVGDIMTDENKLITVSPDTKVLRAMELMTGMFS
jgi:CBS domain-containing protein